MVKSVATARWQLATALAPSHLVLGRRSMPSISQHQQLRSVTTTLGGAVLGTASCAAFLAPLVLVARSLRRKQINKQLQNTLDQARELQDHEKRRQVFFDVTRRHARNNGSRVDLKDTFDREMDVDELLAEIEEGTSACGLKTINPHNFRYSIHTSKLWKWKLWVAVDAEFGVRPDRETSTSSNESNGTGNDGDNREVTLPRKDVLDPFITMVCLLMQRNLRLAASGEATGEQAEGSSHAEVPEKVSVELLFWDAVVSLDVSTSSMCPRTYWVGKIGERRPSRFGWIIIPIPPLFDIMI